MNVSLYELGATYRQDFDKLLELELSDQAFLDTLESLGGELAVKAENTAAFLRNLESTADAIKDAEAKMAKRRKSLENKADRLRAYVLEVMQANDIQRIECPRFVLSIAKNPPAVEVEDERKIPKHYLTSPKAPEPKPDLTLIKKAIDDGFDVPGARLRQGTRLAIK